MKHYPTLLLPHLCAIAVGLTTAQAGTTDYSKHIQQPAAEAMGFWYWSVLGGVNLEQSADLDDLSGSFGNFGRSYDGDTGWFAALKFGYEFESNAPVHAALELEGIYSHVDGGVRLNRGGFDAEASGDIHQGALMFNALVKFKPIWKFRPYIGAGVGVGYVERDEIETSVRVGGRRIATGRRDGGEDFTFAYQGIAGFDWWVTDRWTLFTEYKALVFDHAVGFDQYLNHLVGVGVRVKF